MEGQTDRQLAIAILTWLGTAFVRQLWKAGILYICGHYITCISRDVDIYFEIFAQIVQHFLIQIKTKKGTSTLKW